MFSRVKAQISDMVNFLIERQEQCNSYEKFSMHSTKKSLYVWTTVVLLILLGLSGKRLFAQVDWSEMQTLIYPQPDWADISLSLVADQYGFVHLAWTRTLENSNHQRPAIYYSRWDGQNWTNPLDIFVTTGWPVLVPGNNAKLHIFWSDGSYLFHSWSGIGDGDSIKAWSQPRVIFACNSPCSVPIDAKKDYEGLFHVVFTNRVGNVYHFYSLDEGENWSVPQPVSTVPLDTTTLMPKLDIADDGRVHVVWAELLLPEGIYLRLNYAHSIDKGATWTQPLELGSGNYADGNILATGKHDVHLVWNGGVGIGGRYYQRSYDGGITWTNPTSFSSLSGRVTYPSILQDRNGMFHMLTADGDYVTYDGRNWSLPTRPLFLDKMEHARLTLANDHQLIAVTPHLNDDAYSGIYYSIKDLPISASTLQTFTTVYPTPTEPHKLEVTQIADDEGTVTTATPVSVKQSELMRGQPPYLPIVIAIGSALAIIIPVVAFVRKSSK